MTAIVQADDTTKEMTAVGKKKGNPPNTEGKKGKNWARKDDGAERRTVIKIPPEYRKPLDALVAKTERTISMEVCRALRKAFEENGIPFPFPEDEGK